MGETNPHKVFNCCIEHFYHITIYHIQSEYSEYKAQKRTHYYVTTNKTIEHRTQTSNMVKPKHIKIVH